LPGVTLRLFREERRLKATTDADGRYAFSQLPAGSYRLCPRLKNCRFLPRNADLDHLTASTTVDFGGSGPGCGGPPVVNEGATSGQLIISGHLRDASGQPIVGARVDLHGCERAIRFTDFTGGYSFHVNPGEFELRAAGACSFTPSEAHKDVYMNVVQDFIGGDGCATASQSDVTATGSVFTVRQGSTVLGITYVHIEQYSGPAEASARLQEIAAEQATPSRSLTIAGNPAIERQTLVTLETPDPDLAGPAGSRNPTFTALTAAIAVGNNVVRYETQLPQDVASDVVSRFFQLDRNFTPDALHELHGAALTPVPMIRNTPGSSPTAPGILASGPVAPGAFGELQIAASDTANAVIYGTQNGPFVSFDGGQTVKASTFNTAPAPPAAAFSSLGDPAVAVGAPDNSFHQAVYFAQLQQAAPPPPNGKPIAAIALYQSPDNGQTFNSTSFPINCNNATANCVVPDQEQLGTDRVNRAALTNGNFDQLYLAWRNYTSQTTNAHTIAVACSRDGGITWNTDRTTVTATGVDFPRLGVGPDGSLLVAYAVYNPFPTSYALNIQKWSSCANGFQPSGGPHQVAKVTEVTDMPGLDRQALGNYMPAFDDGDGSAQTIFVVYANEASTGNDDIHVAESRDGGTTWTRDSIINTVGTGRRYFPWICSTVGKKFVTWYDRRNSTAASPDLTGYYRSSVFDNGSSQSVGIGTEFDVSGVDDPQCAPGFTANLVRGTVEESQCTNLPAAFIQGGTCQAPCAAGVPGPCGSGQACDFRNPVCNTPGETCQTTGAGQPKYGDYNGAACALGTLFVAWASATPPKGAACLVAGLACSTASQCCSNNCVGGACAPTAAACTPNGGACGPGLPTCCSASLNGSCQGGICLPTIAMYTSSSCIGPQCAGPPATIAYHQVGACNGSATNPGIVSVGPNAAYVIFNIESIDNSQGSTNFAFDPTNLFVQQARQDFFDPGLSIYPKLFGTFAAVPTTVSKGQDLKFNVNALGALVVTTTTTDGAVEANNTGYFLLYNRQPTDPLINLVKSNASRTSFPVTEDCTTIQLQ
jgi:hypothetical protein